MELKNYQQDIINDLTEYLSILSHKTDLDNAWKAFWNARNIVTGTKKFPEYKHFNPDIPSICFKVPTGGGKTLIASASIKPVFDAINDGLPKVVVWLVPSETIRTQTINNLRNPKHPYRQRLNADFRGRVEIYTKEQLLAGQYFSPVIVQEQLSILVLSFDSFRSKQKNEKAYRENSNLSSFGQYYTSKDKVEDADNTSLYQVIHDLNPMVIVDESHNASSKLSRDMLRDFNPCFMIELTATPKNSSNILCYVDAMQLKYENMVKLPVVVFNRHNRQEVIYDAISLRCALEKIAKAEKEYIRPIVLFQAQPKSQQEDSSTYTKIRDKLIEYGIPRNEIAIKTSNINELKNVDLLSKGCPIRYIVTVNALKEGWDCPFAYILASLANRSSSIDVEQIVGRILRQPHARRMANGVLNTSYVLTSSPAFFQTLETLRLALVNAGFSENEVRSPEICQYSLPGSDNTPSSIFTPPSDSSNVPENDEQANREDDLLEPPNRPTPITSDSNDNNDLNSIDQNTAKMLDCGKKEEQKYLGDLEDSQHAKTHLSDLDNQYGVKPEFKGLIESIKIPQFFIQSGSSLFGESSFLESTNLCRDVDLRHKDTKIDFDAAIDNIATIDIEHGVPRINREITSSLKEVEREYLSQMKSANRIKTCIDMIKNIITNKFDEVSDNELLQYITNVVNNMETAQLDRLENEPNRFAELIKIKIDTFLLENKRTNFRKWIDSGKIVCCDNYLIPEYLITSKPNNSYGKSLYLAEDGDMNDTEKRFISKLTGYSNVIWWHRIISKKGFVINSFINHYPDFMIFMKSCIIIMAETKGPQLKNNDDTRAKLDSGLKWAELAGNKYKYCMIFDDSVQPMPNTYTESSFFELIQNMDF